MVAVSFLRWRDAFFDFLWGPLAGFPPGSHGEQWRTARKCQTANNGELSSHFLPPETFTRGNGVPAANLVRTFCDLRHASEENLDDVNLYVLSFSPRINFFLCFITESSLTFYTGTRGRFLHAGCAH